ncbi:MAG TPA: hypothetical protein VGB53_00320 [Rubricoccaceae bacterium]
MAELTLCDPARAVVTVPAFPFYLDGPAGECFGAEPAEYDGAPVVRLVALSLPVCISRGDAPVTADLAGAEGLVSVETLRQCYLGAAPDPWTLRSGAPLPAVQPVAVLSASVALTLLATAPSSLTD